MTLPTLPVVPSLKLPVAVSCKLWPTRRFGFAGVTVIPLSVGFTKKPRQPLRAAINMKVAAVTNSASRLHFGIINIASKTFRDEWLVGYRRL